MRKISKKAIREFKAYLISEEKAEATVEKYLRDITAFAEWLGERPLCKESVIEYKEHLKSGYAKTSINSALAALNSFFGYAGLYGLRVKSVKIQRRIFAGRERELTKAEYRRLLGAAQKKGDRRLFFVMQTICATGLRVSDDI